MTTQQIHITLNVDDALQYVLRNAKTVDMAIARIATIISTLHSPNFNGLLIGISHTDQDIEQLCRDMLVIMAKLASYRDKIANGSSDTIDPDELVDDILVVARYFLENIHSVLALQHHILELVHKHQIRDDQITGWAYDINRIIAELLVLQSFTYGTVATAMTDDNIATLQRAIAELAQQHNIEAKVITVSV